MSFGQGFYGWIGDTRIVKRVLRPQDFMNHLPASER